MAKIVVLGAGIMGLAAAYRAAKNGHEVTVVEASSEPGGMAGHFDFGGISIERYYHFICQSDYATFDLLKELGRPELVKWVNTSMGFYHNGRLYEWGTPVALLKLPTIGLMEKLRYGWFALNCTRRDQWPELENQSAKAWITHWMGAKAYDAMWRPLFQYKFYNFADNVSASWIWTRIRRIGRSRRSLMQEELGYLEGGTLTLVNLLVDAVRGMGGEVRLGAPAQTVETGDGRLTGVRLAGRDGAEGEFVAADHVISTVPTPYVSAMVPSLPDAWKARYDAIDNIACICLIFKLRRSVTPHFWVNVNEPGVEIPGVIEFSNLRPMPDGLSITYVPYYMPTTEAKWHWDDAQLLSEAWTLLRRLNPSLTGDDIVDSRVARLRFGQPVCDPGFLAKIPPVQTPIAGLQVADTCYYYPEDRGVAESLRLGQQMADAVDGKPVQVYRPVVPAKQAAEAERASAAALAS